MIKNNKFLAILFVTVILPFFSQAQFNNNTTSPYSRYGLGDLQSYSFGRTAAMGGASIASRNNRQINFSNPASYTTLDSLSFLFELGISGKFAKYESDQSSMTTNDVNLSYFALNFRITDWMVASFGLKPYSDVGFDVTIKGNDDNIGEYINKYYGHGSLSRAFFGLGVKVIDNVSIGANMNYMFGKLNRSSQTYFASQGTYNNSRYESIRVSDFGFEFGLQAIYPLNETEKIIFGATMEAKPKYKAYHSNLNIKEIPGNYQSLDTLSYKDEEESSITLPLSLGFGVSYVKRDMWEINADYSYHQWKDAEFFGSTNELLTNANRFAIGGEWVPEKYSIRNFFKRTAYRVGIKYEQSYLMLNDNQINDFGITFGLGLPVYRSQSTINLGFEIGQKGTKNDNLLLERYAKFNLSVNLHDLWFIKRKFD